VSRLSFRQAGGGLAPRTLPRLACLALALAGAIQAASAAWIPVKAMTAQMLLERAFEQSLADGAAVRPWPWADMAPLARISVERLGESSIVLSGASGQAMAFGPTELPTRPGSGITVLAAHRDTHFAFMQELRIGDTLTGEGVDGSRASYRIERFETVRWDEFAVPQFAPGEWLALTTCYPFDATGRSPLRRVAWARKLG
jgi:sortase A